MSSKIPTVRIVFVNAAYDSTVPSPDALLDAYSTLTGWCRAVADAGAEVTVAQRFHVNARRQRDGVRYLFLNDGGPPQPSVWWASRLLIDAALSDRPDLVHINGMGYPRLVSGVKALRPAAVVVVQDHGGQAQPPAGVGWSRGIIMRPGLRRADACLFTSTDQAQVWRDAGLIGSGRVLEVVESSTTLHARRRDEARARTGMTGNPAILWVGRLDANKDPLTIVDAIEQAIGAMPDARAYFVYHDAPLAGAVADRLSRSPVLAARTTMVGAVPHDRMADYYSSADVFVSGSRAEGSGYALIEALACGLTPVVTDIAPFRAIAGDTGARFAPGDARACAEAIAHVNLGDREERRRAARARFDAALTWRAIGARAMGHYRALAGSRTL